MEYRRRFDYGRPRPPPPIPHPYDRYDDRRPHHFGGGYGGSYGGGRGGMYPMPHPSFMPHFPPPIMVRGAGGKRTCHRAIVSGLPPTGSWQDLKDHMRRAGDVCFTDVFRDGTGLVEYARADDLKYALRKLDQTKFTSHQNETSYITVKEDLTHRERSRSPHRSHRERERSPREVRERTPARRSRSASRSRSRS